MGKVIPKFSVKKDGNDTLLIGQLNSAGELHGIGKKITPYFI